MKRPRIRAAHQYKYTSRPLTTPCLARQLMHIALQINPQSRVEAVQWMTSMQSLRLLIHHQGGNILRVGRRVHKTNPNQPACKTQYRQQGHENPNMRHPQTQWMTSTQSLPFQVYPQGQIPKAWYEVHRMSLNQASPLTTACHGKHCGKYG